MRHNDALAVERLEAARSAQGSEQTFQVIVGLIHAGLYQSEVYTAAMNRLVEQEREERRESGKSYTDEALTL